MVLLVLFFVSIWQDYYKILEPFAVGIIKHSFMKKKKMFCSKFKYKLFSQMLVIEGSGAS